MDFGNLISGFGNTGFTLVAFVVALSIIVAIHEYGHYIVGRWCGIHAEVFSLGFGPTLFSRVDRHGTKWQLAALPFGGYVKFMGDKDAASGIDGEAISGLSAVERRRTMHGAPIWARALTVAAGPVFNFILSILIFAAFALWFGTATERNVVGEVKPYPFVGETLQVGDEITAIDGKPTPDPTTLAEVVKKIAPVPEVTYTVLRDGQSVDVKGPHPQAAIASSVVPLTAAYDAGLQQGDVIVSVNAVAIYSFEQLREITGASEGKPLDLGVWRDGEVLEIKIVPRLRDDLPTADGFETRWSIGVTGQLLFEPETRRTGLYESARFGVRQLGAILTGTASAISHIVQGKMSTCNLKGPIGIAKTSGAAASMGLESFILLIAGLSAAVGLMNLFPIPVLDGGHLVFHAWEAVTRRPPPERVMQVMMATGFAAIMALMFFALSRDLFC